MNITLTHTNLFNLLSKGSWYTSVTIPKEIAADILNQDTDKVFVFEPQSDGQSYSVMWTREGWEEECKRRIWLGKIREPIKISKTALEKQMQEASIKGDLAETMRIAKQLKEYENQS